jgi:hypothetical protein
MSSAKIALQIESFESYITSLIGYGVFPSFHRYSDGWYCILRNEHNKQIMPLTRNENCWGESMYEAVIVAIEGLNARFADLEELQKHIQRGADLDN